MIMNYTLNLLSTFLTSKMSDSEIMVYVWLGVFLLALIIELSTTDLISIWFAAGAIISLILSLCKVPWYISLIVFAVTSTLFLLLVRKLFKKKLDFKEVPTNSDTLVGEEITITKDCTKDVMGETKIRDVVWSVESTGDSIVAGEKAIIKEVSGNHLVVEKKEEK